MNLTLTRTVAGFNADATAGDLEVGGKLLYTLELPWRDNAPGTSCVPLGKYDLIPYNSPRHGPTWSLRNVDLLIMGCDALTSAQIAVGYRTLCELHSCNFPEQLEGCIGFGLDDQPLLNVETGLIEPVAVESSRAAVAYLTAQLGPMSSGHTLTIVQASL